MDITKYLSGELLYGDDFSTAQIENWYREEEEGYAGLGANNTSNYSYSYHNLNKVYGYNFLNNISNFKSVLGIGSAYGHEFLPIIDKITKLTILEPSNDLISLLLADKVVPKYVKPNIDGAIDFSDNSFDLITSFGTLHHIPNVSYVLGELIRVLAPNGVLLIREPIRTMGDWREKREGLTANERGIPHQYFDNFFAGQNVKILKKNFCDFNPAFKVLNKLFKIKRDTELYQIFDKYISYLFKWNVYYHPRNGFAKIAPASVFYIVQKI